MNKSEEHSIRAVLFDWAGTVVDHGSWAPVAVFIDVFHARGIELQLEQVRAPMGMAKREHIRTLLEDPKIRRVWRDRHGRDVRESDTEELYREFLDEQERAILERSDLIEGVCETVAFLKERGIRIGSTTGYPRELAKGLIDAAAIQGFEPECTVTASEVPAGRPAPWMIFRACEELGAYPVSAVVNVDDTIAGVQAARHAGCWSVGVSRTGNLVGLSLRDFKALSPAEQEERVRFAGKKLEEAGAHFVVGSVGELPDVIRSIENPLQTVMV